MENVSHLFPSSGMPLSHPHSVILLVAAFAAARSLPLRKAKLDEDSRAISAMAVLWGLVCIFESYRAYRGELLAAKVLLPLAAGLAASLFPRSRTAIGLSYTVVFAVWLRLRRDATRTRPPTPIPALRHTKTRPLSLASSIDGGASQATNALFSTNRLHRLWRSCYRSHPFFTRTMDTAVSNSARMGVARADRCN